MGIESNRIEIGDSDRQTEAIDRSGSSSGSGNRHPPAALHCTARAVRCSDMRVAAGGLASQAANAERTKGTVAPATTGAVRPLGQPTGAEGRAQQIAHSSRIASHSRRRRGEGKEINRRYSNKPDSSPAHVQTALWLTIRF